MSDTGDTVRLEVRDDAAYLTLDSPPLNIMTESMMRELARLLERVAGDRSLKAVVFASTGKAFSAGADVAEHSPERAPGMIGAFSDLFEALAALELPIVMAVDGAALGAGFELAMMGDFVLATPRAKFGQPEIRLGFFAPVAVSLLPALVGPARAMQITCSGRTYSAEEMREFGIVTRIEPPEALIAAVESTLDEIRRASPLVLRMNVRLLKRLAGQPFEQARREAERVFLDELMATEEVREGIAAFEQKRRPEWKNR